MKQKAEVQRVDEVDLNEEMIVSQEENYNLELVNIQKYKQKLLEEEIERNLLKAEEDIENGKVVAAEEVFKY